MTEPADKHALDASDALPCPGCRIKKKMARLRVLVKEGAVLAIKQGCELSELEIEGLVLDMLFTRWSQRGK